MSKQEFLAQLRKGLSGLPQDDVDECLTYYGEMIEDRIEEGLSEEQAVSAVGSVKEIVAQTVSDVPISKIAKERIKSKRRLSAGEIILLALGSPIWLSLLITLLAVIFSLYVVLWSVIISLWAVFASLAACSVGGVVSGVVFAIGDNGLKVIAVIAAGVVCAGLSIFMFYGCNAATRGILIFTKKMAIWIKNCFIRKGVA